MQKIKKQKGITLIALIITIIVMLILVAVTLVITLGENGIIAKARTAKEKQALRQEAEKLELGANAGDKINALVKDGTPWNLNTSGEEKGSSDFIIFRWPDVEEKCYYYSNGEVDSSKLISINGEPDEGYVYSGLPNSINLQSGDRIYFEGDDFLYEFNGNGFWTWVLDTEKTSYGSLKSDILGYQLVDMSSAFECCEGATIAPTIPITVTDISYCFKDSTIVEASYEGTVEQFKLIEGYDTIGSVIIHCVGGDYPEE